MCVDGYQHLWGIYPSTLQCGYSQYHNSKTGILEKPKSLQLNQITTEVSGKNTIRWNVSSGRPAPVPYRDETAARNYWQPVAMTARQTDKEESVYIHSLTRIHHCFSVYLTTLYAWHVIHRETMFNEEFWRKGKGISENFPENERKIQTRELTSETRFRPGGFLKCSVISITLRQSLFAINNTARYKTTS